MMYVWSAIGAGQQSWSRPHHTQSAVSRVRDLLCHDHLRARISNDRIRGLGVVATWNTHCLPACIDHVCHHRRPTSAQISLDEVWDYHAKLFTVLLHCRTCLSLASLPRGCIETIRTYVAITSTLGLHEALASSEKRLLPIKLVRSDGEHPASVYTGRPFRYVLNTLLCILAVTCL